jgi:hypothetical protein
MVLVLVVMMIRCLSIIIPAELPIPRRKKLCGTALREVKEIDLAPDQCAHSRADILPERGALITVFICHVDVLCLPVCSLIASSFVGSSCILYLVCMIVCWASPFQRLVMSDH